MLTGKEPELIFICNRRGLLERLITEKWESLIIVRHSREEFFEVEDHYYNPEADEVQLWSNKFEPFNWRRS